MTQRTLALVILSFVFSANVFAAEIPVDKVLNNGQDVTRPLARFDVRYQYQLLAKKYSKDIFTFRTDRPFVLNDDWQIATRLDLPCVLTNKKTPQEPNGPYKFGLGDLLSQGLLVRISRSTFNGMALCSIKHSKNGQYESEMTREMGR